MLEEPASPGGARLAETLLERSSFADRVAVRLSANPLADPAFLALEAYAAALYRACSGIDGRQEQERGYQELHAYLSACAAQYPQVASAATAQHTVEHVHQQFGR